MLLQGVPVAVGSSLAEADGPVVWSSQGSFGLDWQVGPWEWTGGGVSDIVHLSGLGGPLSLQYGQGFLSSASRSSKLYLTKGCFRVLHDEA